MELLVIHSTLRARSQGNEHRQGWAEAEAGCDCTSFRTFHRLLNSGRAMATDDRVPLPLARGSHQSSPDWQRSIEKDEGSRSPQRPCAPSTQQKYRGVEFPSGQVFCLLLYQYVSFSFSLWLTNQLPWGLRNEFSQDTTLQRFSCPPQHELSLCIATFPRVGHSWTWPQSLR